ncbi:hypothetical protein [Marinobacter caseinilyticus]|uniref:hypothetical protein n=1 Tax=Marinobacter caseinilyticus TaxID=2692195 RepID=UPI00140D893F|nr:hypothetical protein [Marinobacter caseinilyticus]
MTREAFKHAAPALLCLFSAVHAHAELTPISDKEMGEVQGQAMIAVDRTIGTSEQFTRVTLGMDAEIQTNIDSLALGETVNGTDLAVDHLSLGHISSNAAQVQLDGQTYAVGDIVPFVGADPYFELAEQNGEVVGFRFGLNKARGTLSGDIGSFSGNIGLQIDDGSGVGQAATLFDAAGSGTSYQATHIGLVGADCATAGGQCAPLSNLQTLDVGVDNGDGTVGFAEDFFLSFQKQAVEWTDVDGAGAVAANPGVFFNVPTSMTLDLQTLQNGIPRARTEYIDRGMGLF